MGTAIETSVNHSSAVFPWNIRKIHSLIKDVFEDIIGLNFEYYGNWEPVTSDIFEVGAGTTQHSRWKFSVTKRDRCMHYYQDEPGDGLALGIHFLGFVQSGNGASASDQKVKCRVRAWITGLSRKKNLNEIEEIDEKYEFSTRDHERFQGFIDWNKLCPQHHRLFTDHVMTIKIKLTLIGGTVTKTVLDFGQLSQQETQNVEHDFGQFYNNPALSDFSVILSRDSASPVQFFAHKFILAARSPVFRRMLETPMREARENKLVIKDMDLQTLTLMLQFIYKGKIKIPEDKICIFGLFNAAKKYDLKGLSKLVLLKLQSLLNDANIGELTVAAYECARGHDEVISVLRNYCQTRQNILWKNPEYKKLYQQNPAAFMGE